MRIRSKSTLPPWDPELLNGPVKVIKDGIPQIQPTSPTVDPRRHASGVLRARVLFRDNYECRYCGVPVDNDTANVDHVVPWKLGGQTRMRNLVTCCRPCNRRKGNQVWKPKKIRRRRDRRVSNRKAAR